MKKMRIALSMMALISNFALANEFNDLSSKEFKVGDFAFDDGGEKVKIVELIAPYVTIKYNSVVIGNKKVLLSSLARMSGCSSDNRHCVESYAVSSVGEKFKVLGIYDDGDIVVTNGYINHRVDGKDFYRIENKSKADCSKNGFNIGCKVLREDGQDLKIVGASGEMIVVDLGDDSYVVNNKKNYARTNGCTTNSWFCVSDKVGIKKGLRTATGDLADPNSKGTIVGIVDDNKFAVDWNSNSKEPSITFVERDQIILLEHKMNIKVFR